VLPFLPYEIRYFRRKRTELFDDRRLRHRWPRHPQGDEACGCDDGRRQDGDYCEATPQGTGRG